MDFPNSPTNGQTFAGSNGATYVWDGSVWTAVGTTTGPPSGPAGGDLAGSTYPNPVVAAGAINRAKTASDLWLAPVPTGGNVGQVLGVASGPALAWTTPSGGGGGWTIATAGYYSYPPSTSTSQVMCSFPISGGWVVGKVYRLSANGYWDRSAHLVSGNWFQVNVNFGNVIAGNYYDNATTGGTYSWGIDALCYVRATNELDLQWLGIGSVASGVRQGDPAGVNTITVTCQFGQAQTNNFSYLYYAVLESH